MPRVIMLAGPNGAGKSTAAVRVLRDTIGVREFVNADTIATGLSAFDPSRVALQAGRLMLERLEDLATQSVDFAFETTAASRTFAPWLLSLKSKGYTNELFFFWLPSAEMAIARVAGRVAEGGHHVPDETVRRRYKRGLTNFFSLYRPLADHWCLYNSAIEEPSLIAEGQASSQLLVHDDRIWTKLCLEYDFEAHP